ncbi:hypothetical protein N7462_002752 [Penicillium macrosclerotiorum]|uniref:uncharacterized protein n=1 Tax=Penicillium macrosclerotiorum TaxID=303699 RepID=UPI002547543F|nr:uncharacterized protein N7462_002752 [Penicillium macrosclerotiorum]KAJ5693329.1 hypothetical protein N7462_002752 [Penicillium macrosclerotiorum]
MIDLIDLMSDLISPDNDSVNCGVAHVPMRLQWTLNGSRHFQWRQHPNQHDDTQIPWDQAPTAVQSGSVALIGPPGAHDNIPCGRITK